MLAIPLIILVIATRTRTDTFTLGYLTGSQRRPGKLNQLQSLKKVQSVALKSV